MTEISNVKSNAPAVDRQVANARDPVGESGIGRFSDAGVTAAGEGGPAPASKTATSLDSGQDPLEKAAQTIEELIGDTGPSTKLRIDKDDETGRFVYKSVDAESGEVVAQFPPETILEMISRFRDPEGLAVDDEA